MNDRILEKIVFASTCKSLDFCLHVVFNKGGGGGELIRKWDKF